MAIERISGSDEKSVLESVIRAVAGIEFSSFAVGITCTDVNQKSVMRTAAEKIVFESSKALPAKKDFDLYILVDIENGFVSAEPQPVFIEGCYNKFSRKIAQTFHYCFKCRGKGCAYCGHAGKLSELSVQELVEKTVLPAFGSLHGKFHGCGREDVDVLMLGNGRPFVLEVISPAKRKIDLKKIGQEINSLCAGLVSVRNLSYCQKEKISEFKSTEFKKTYSAKCRCGEPINENELGKIVGAAFDVVQFTPLRVEKRRVLKERKKMARILSAKILGEKEFALEIIASHGLNVKEFFSCDSGRTTPIVSSFLGKECVCAELDVLEIVLK